MTSLIGENVKLELTSTSPQTVTKVTICLVRVFGTVTGVTGNVITLAGLPRHHLHGERRPRDHDLHLGWRRLSVRRHHDGCQDQRRRPSRHRRG